MSIFINSRDRDGGRSDNFTININPNLDKVKNLKIKDISIPYSFYNITSFNNTFEWNLSSATLSIGNYTIFDLFNEMSILMNTAEPGFNYSFSLDPLTNKVQIDANMSFTLIFGELWEMLGFIETNLTSSSFGPNQRLVANNIYKIRTDVIYISSNLIPISQISTSVNNIPSNAKTEQTILDMIPLDNQQFDEYIIVNEFIDTYNIQTSRISNIRLSLLDDRLRPLDLNGRDWQIQFSYDRACCHKCNS